MDALFEEQFPDELYFEILSHLSLLELFDVASVSRLFQRQSYALVTRIALALTPTSGLVFTQLPPALLEAVKSRPKALATFFLHPSFTNISGIFSLYLNLAPRRAATRPSDQADTKTEFEAEAEAPILIGTTRVNLRVDFFVKLLEHHPNVEFIVLYNGSSTNYDCALLTQAALGLKHLKHFYSESGNFSNSWVERMFVQLPELEEISLPNHGGREFASKLDLLLYRYQYDPMKDEPRQGGGKFKLKHYDEKGDSWSIDDFYYKKPGWSLEKLFKAEELAELRAPKNLVEEVQDPFANHEEITEHSVAEV